MDKIAISILRKKVIFLVLTITVLFSNNAEAKKEDVLSTGQTVSISATVKKALSFLRSRITSIGLTDSYVEDATDYSYTYDNALAAMAFISAGDINSARKILDAFYAIGPEPEGGFLNRYHATDGRRDGILSAGHNAYLLQAMNLYYMETGDSLYNTLAQGIANYLLSLQDSDGGLFGRKGVTWKSTENNIGALSAIHNMGKAQQLPYYIEKANQIRNFITTECWDGAHFLCGENDPMIVTDVQALGAMVLGAGYTNGASWIENYTLTTKRYKGRRSITGFDLNTDRDTVWTEGTLQESMAFLIAGDILKFNIYKTEAEKLFQPSGALLLASNKGTTGFDWTLEPWQAVAPTAWYIYVSNEDNVLEVLP